MDSLEIQVVIICNQTATTVAGSCVPTLEWAFLFLVKFLIITRLFVPQTQNTYRPYRVLVNIHI